MKKKIIVLLLIIAGFFLLNIPAKQAYVLPILMYHKIDKEESLKTKLAVSPEAFEKQMAFLKRCKYNTVSLKEAVELIKAKKKIPHNTVVITFDDGYENNYTKAYPVLKKYNIPATIFVIVDFIGRPGYFTAEQVKELSGSGLVTIGSHTLEHKVLTQIDDLYLDKEIFYSKKILEVFTKKPVELLCYPLGAFNEKVRQKVIDAGYIAAVATNPGKDYPKDDIYALKRIRISENSANMFIFWAEISGYYTFIKEHRDD
ncbi:MAG: polysaccharide deacetylase [Candidatus Omnitrophica bacterium CG11_big_fil_rev_8_21_14_0_20_42_13]|uniref:Polysaccharide deacetylase n=1 Tax=Candidatus Ghiorseimicrobium undicola TaxID=1974746 RepID=A0A2H0LXH0_9BACT|nr:MAG: polysaccharide deacetylase [Candidatus Omnitrophica bacterium CG11_big_fil_rev_8_21_14_0_20_42_13]